MFLVGDPNLNLHLPLESWEGGCPPSYTDFHLRRYVLDFKERFGAFEKNLFRIGSRFGATPGF